VSPNIRKFRFSVSKHDLSNFHGLGGRNIKAIKILYPEAHIVIDSNHHVPPGNISLTTEAGEIYSIDIPGIAKVMENVCV
jgi:hypothetical protein